MSIENMIEMIKDYRYKNGEAARILCIDGFDKDYSVVSMRLDGLTVKHTSDGLPLGGLIGHQLVEITQYDHIKDGDQVIVWNLEEHKFRRIFAKVSFNGKPTVYLSGKTKWTSYGEMIPWNHCELAN